jgi:hypothetical protein
LSARMRGGWCPQASRSAVGGPGGDQEFGGEVDSDAHVAGRHGRRASGAWAGRGRRAADVSDGGRRLGAGLGDVAGQAA